MAKILFKLCQVSGWILFFLTILFFVSGYGMTKQIIPVNLAVKIHNQILPIPFLLFLILHCLFPGRNLFKRIPLKIILAVLFLFFVVGLAGFLIYQEEKMPKVSPGDFYPARFYETLDNKIVRCNLCPNRCILSQEQIGLCKARKNVDGKLYSMVYGKIASWHLDPVEKKPIFHFLPGSLIYSISTTGCNLQCKFCQNWQISQVFPWEVETKKMTPEEVVEDAIKSGAKSIAFTYNEPTIYYEYMFDIAKLAKEKGLKTAVISSGYINPEPLKELLPYIDAYKIDFKGISDKFYQRMTVSGKVEPVMEAMKIIKEKGVWLEIVNLVIPGENDSEEDLENLILWVKNNLGTDVPLHFSRFHPDYKLLNVPPTPIETLKKARKMAIDLGLKYVYIGNVDDVEGSTTYCPESKEPAIVRKGFFVLQNNLLPKGQCRSGEKIPGIWE
jgi:pyruvate formate lyase activating enzyme